MPYNVSVCVLITIIVTGDWDERQGSARLPAWHSDVISLCRWYSNPGVVGIKLFHTVSDFVHHM